MNDFKKFKKRFLIFLIFFTLLLSLIPSVYAGSEKDFYAYTGGYGIQKVFQYFKTNMSKNAESENYSGTINALISDDTYVYSAGATTNKVIQYWRSNMTKKQESSAYGGNLYALTQDDTYIYAGGATVNIVSQYWKSNLTKKQDSVNVGGIIRALVQDANYVYAGGDNENVSKFYKSNLTLITSAPYPGGILALTIDDTYLYGGGGTTQKVYQWWTSNLTKKQESADYGAMIRTLASDSTYVYVAGNTVNKIFRLWKSNLTKDIESDSYGNSIISIALDNRYIYAGGYNPGGAKVFQYWLSNLTKKSESAIYSLVINAVIADQQVAPDSPSPFTATPYGRFRIDLSWTKGWGADYTYIEAKLNSYPTGRTDGTNIYNGTGTSYSHTGLNPNEHWFYSAWSWNTTDSDWSYTNLSADTTTLANTAPSYGTPSPTNGSTGQNPTLTWSIPISDINGDTFNWTIQCSNGQSNNANSASNGTKTLSLSGLAYNTTFTVWVNTTDGYDWTRAWYQLTTRSEYATSPPSSFTATDYNRTRIDLSWTNGANADYTYIEAKLGSYPSSRTDGTNIYNGTGTNYSNTGLNPNEHWFYTAWAWNATDSVWSVSYAQANATTTTNTPPNFGTPNPANNSTNQPASFSWNISIYDLDGDTFNWSIQCSNGQSSSANGSSNGTKILSLSGLNLNVTYTVWVNATDFYGSSTQQIYYFSTHSHDYIFTAFVPADGSTNVDIFPTLYLHVAQWEGKPFNLTWYIKPNGMSTILLSTVSNLYNGTYSINLSTLGHAELGYYAWNYEWYVIANNYTDDFQYSTGVLNYQTKSFSYESLGVEVKMDVWMIVLWLVIWAILLFVNIKSKSKIFGGFAGAWLFLLGIFIIASGVQIETGKITTTIGPGQTVEYAQYSNVLLPFNTYSYVWGVFMFVLAVYIMFANIRAKASED